jgi:hypothetical protein
MKRKLLIVTILCLAFLLAACAAPEPITTSLGDFVYEQIFTSQLGEETASEGNTYFVVYLTPAEGNEVSLDDAQEYFYSGVKARVDEDQYEMTFLAYEKIDDSFVRFGLVFEVVDNDFENAKQKPETSLILP